MTDTPERIWAWHYVTDKRDDLTKGGWNDEHDRGLVEYVRSDLSADRLAAAENLAEALRSAAEDLDDYSPLTGNTIETPASRAARAAIAAWEASK